MVRPAPAIKPSRKTTSSARHEAPLGTQAATPLFSRDHCSSRFQYSGTVTTISKTLDVQCRHAKVPPVAQAADVSSSSSNSAPRWRCSWPPPHASWRSGAPQCPMPP